MKETINNDKSPETPSISVDLGRQVELFVKDYIHANVKNIQKYLSSL